MGTAVLLLQHRTVWVVVGRRRRSRTSNGLESRSSSTRKQLSPRPARYSSSPRSSWLGPPHPVRSKSQFARRRVRAVLSRGGRRAGHLLSKRISRPESSSLGCQQVRHLSDEFVRQPDRDSISPQHLRGFAAQPWRARPPHDRVVMGSDRQASRERGCRSGISAVVVVLIVASSALFGITNMLSPLQGLLLGMLLQAAFNANPRPPAEVHPARAPNLRESVRP